MTQNDPEAPGPAAPGTTPGTDANTADIVATGDDRVDQALRRLGELAGLPLPEHAAVFEHIHAELTGALGTLDYRKRPVSAPPHRVRPDPARSGCSWNSRDPGQLNGEAATA